MDLNELFLPDPEPRKTKVSKSEKPTVIADVGEHPKAPALINSWPSGLSVEVALDEMVTGEKFVTQEDLAEQFDLTVERLQQIKQHPAFRAEVRAHMGQFREDGAEIKRKAKAILGQYLDYKIHDWLKEPGASLDARTKLLQFVAKLTGMEAAEKAAEAAKSQGQVQQAPSINITLTQAPAQQVPSIMLNAERVVSG